MDNFNDFWAAYQPDEKRFPNRKAATFREWCTRTSAARLAMMKAVMTEGAPKWKNPFFYVQDFPEPQPEFLRGDEGGDLVQVRYNGAFKICTRQTAQLFNLQILKDWN